MADHKSILVTDDRAGICRLLTEILTSYGHRVKTAADGAEALKVVSKEKFDIVLLDMKMPGMDGLETLTRLKKNRLRWM